MSSRYPIVRHRELRLFFWWSILRQRRSPLTAGRGEKLVYQIGKSDPDYVERNPGLTPARPVTAVSIVDVHRDVPVYVKCHVDAGPGYFSVRATFRCTVISPVTVVQNRRTDAIRNMGLYLGEKVTRATQHLDVPCEADAFQQVRTELLERRPVFAPIPGVQVVLTSLDDVEFNPGEA